MHTGDSGGKIGRTVITKDDGIENVSSLKNRVRKTFLPRRHSRWQSTRESRTKKGSLHVREKELEGAPLSKLEGITWRIHLLMKTTTYPCSAEGKCCCLGPDLFIYIVVFCNRGSTEGCQHGQKSTTDLLVYNPGEHQVPLFSYRS